jgi:hypothetical protein
VTEYIDPDAWGDAAGPFTTIDFTGFPDGTIIVEQYADQGIHFTDGIDVIHHVAAYVNDGQGLIGAFDEIAVAFDQPMYTIAVDFPGFVQFELFDQGELIYTSTIFTQGLVGNFAGLVSTRPFDAAIILDPTGGVSIDDLHFGPPIPGPASAALLTMALVAAPCRRRHPRSWR